MTQTIQENFAGVVAPHSDEAQLLARIDAARLPQHVAVIMDGNGRWARAKGKPRIFGHRAGAEAVREIVNTGARLNLKALTLYAFSTENWKRPKAEISGLMQMLKRFLKSELQNVHRNNIKFQAIGNIAGLDDSVRRELAAATDFTRENTGMMLSIALNYGGRAEITEAAKKAAQEILESGKSLDELSEADIEKNLSTRDLPEVDLLVRTSGEFRVSNFLLWQIAYSEIYVTPTLFPDFRRAEFFAAVLDFQRRERRFGDVKSK